MRERKASTVTFGLCQSEQMVRDGIVAGVGVDADGFHAQCPGVLRRPDLVEKGQGGVVLSVLEENRVTYCACPGHAGETIVAKPVAAVTREVPQEKGQRDRKLADQLSDALEKTGTASLPIPDGADAKESNCINSRLHTAARRRGMKVSVKKVDDRWIATVKGGTRKEAGK